MKRVLAALCALAGASGCYGTTYVETPAPQYGTTMEYIPDAPPAPISVTIPPPAPRYEPVLTCGYGTIYVPGRWDWTGRWYWARGYCSPVRPGYIYVGPRFMGGTYYRAHWAQASYGAPAYPGGMGQPVYRPAPVYGGGGTVVAPPPPVYRPAPVYGGGPTVVAPPPPRPMGAPVYSPPGVAPGYRPAPAPGGYQPAPAPGGYRPQPSYPAPAPAPAPAPTGGYRPPPSAPAPHTGSPPPFHPGGGPTHRVGPPGL